MSEAGFSPVAFELVCVSDFVVIGFAPHEKGTYLVRLASTIITVSIVSSWCNKKNIVRLLLFFSHWLSGLVHQLAQWTLTVLILNCWTRSEALSFMKFVKFLELAGANMLAVSNVAICVNLALVVSSHRTMSPAESMASLKLVLLFWVLSAGITLAAVPFWETFVFTGTMSWSSNSDPHIHTWVMAARFVTELITGVVMAVIVALLLLFRRRELRQVWHLHSRTKFYTALTATAIMVNLCIGIGGTLHVFRDGDPSVAVVSIWTIRHVHIALDTLVLYCALDVSSTRLDCSPPPSSGERRPLESGSKRLRSGDEGRRSGRPYGHRQSTTNGGLRVVDTPRIAGPPARSPAV